MHLRALVKPSSELPAVWKLTNASRISGEFPERAGNSQDRNFICRGTTQAGVLLPFPGKKTLGALTLGRNPSVSSGPLANGATFILSLDALERLPQTYGVKDRF